MFIREQLFDAEDSANVLVVTHGLTSRVLINTLMDNPEVNVNYLNWADNTSFTEIEFSPKTNARNIIRLNDRTHLMEDSLGNSNYEEWGLFSKVEYITE